MFRESSENEIWKRGLVFLYKCIVQSSADGIQLFLEKINVVNHIVWMNTHYKASAITKNIMTGDTLHASKNGNEMECNIRTLCGTEDLPFKLEMSCVYTKWSSFRGWQGSWQSHMVERLPAQVIQVLVTKCSSSVTSKICIASIKSGTAQWLIELYALKISNFDSFKDINALTNMFIIRVEIVQNDRM